MVALFSILAILVGAVVGLVGAHILLSLYRSIVRSSDKRKIKTKMLQEAYYNDLYEEALTEDIDKLAQRAHRKMSKLKTGS